MNKENIVKRKMIGALIYLMAYGLYFGTDIITNINTLINAVENGIDLNLYINLVMSLIGVILPIATLLDLLMDKARKANPKEGSYTNYLFKEGINKILKKFGEEACETIIAAKTNRDDVIYEVSDLMYHLTVLMVELGISWDEIKTELEKR